MSGITRRAAGIFGLAAAFSYGAIRAPMAAEADDPWPDLARDSFNGRPLADGAGLIAIEMPPRAEDAAIVPVTLRTTAPVAATFKVASGVTMISTRVRINSYTNVHAVAELSDGRLYVVQTYVKASGGCSAPAAKNAEEARN